MTEQERQGGWQFPPIPDVDCIKLTGLARNTYYNISGRFGRTLK